MAYLDLLFLLLVLVGFVLVLIFADVLDLRLVVALLVLLHLVFLLGLIIRDLLLALLLHDELDRVADELGVLLDNVLQALLLLVLGLVFLQVEDNLGSPAKGLAIGVGLDREGSAGGGLPNVLLVVVVLGGHDDLVGNEVGGVEADTELTDHTDVGASLERLHEGLRAGLGDGTQVVDEISLGHADAGVHDGEGLVLLVGRDLDEEVLLSLELGGIGEGLIPDLVEGVGRVGDQLTEEDFLVRVECVDDQAHQLSDLGLEGEGLHVRVRHFGCFCFFERENQITGFHKAFGIGVMLTEERLFSEY